MALLDELTRLSMSKPGTMPFPPSSLQGDMFNGVDPRLAQLWAQIQQRWPQAILRETLRTPQQAAANQRAGIGVKNSQHIPGRAMDINGSPDMLAQIGKFAEEQGFRWGGHPGFLPSGKSDPYHIDLGLGSQGQGPIAAQVPSPPIDIPDLQMFAQMSPEDMQALTGILALLPEMI